MKPLIALLLLAGSLQAQGLLSLAGSPPSAAASPTDVSGLSLWLKPESLSGADGDQISAWTDSSANGYTVSQGTAGDRPVITNNVIGSFEAAYHVSNDRLVVSSAGALDITRNKSGHTVFVVFQTEGTITSGSYAYWNSTATASAQRASLAFNSSTTYRSTARRLDGDTAFNSDSDDATVFASPKALCCVWDWGNASFKTWVNGTADINDTTFGTSGSTSDTATVDFLLGGRGTYVRMWVCEWIIYNKALNDTERQTVESYLQAKYALW